MNRQLNKKLSPFIGYLLIATIISYYAGLNLGLQEVGFIVLFPILFAITLLNDKAVSIIKYQETIIFLLFLVLTFTAVFYTNIDYDKFIFTFNKILVAFIAAYIGIALSTKMSLEDYFHVAYIISLFIIIYFEYSSGNFNLATFYAPTAMRYDFAYNANYYSYMSLFANFSIFRLHLKYKTKWTLLGLILIPFLGIAISFTVQTRSGLLFLLLINALFWLWVNKGKIKNPIKLILRKALLLIFAVVLSFQFYNIYDKSNIQNRIGEDARGHLAARGFEVFVDYPFTGVGAGNFANYNRARAFSHNNYIEALSEHGLFMGALIIIVFVLPCFKSYKLFSSDRSNPEYRLNLLFFAVFIIYNNIYVFYQASFAMMYFFLMLGIHHNLVGKKNNT